MLQKLCKKTAKLLQILGILAVTIWRYALQKAPFFKAINARLSPFNVQIDKTCQADSLLGSDKRDAPGKIGKVVLKHLGRK